MKLYTASDTINISMTTEQFNTYYQNAKVISTEAISDYLYKIKDKFSTVYSRLASTRNDKVTIDVTTTKFETLHKLKRLNFVDIKDIIVSKPENFRGKYIDYTSDLIEASSFMLQNTEETLNHLKLAVGSFINESNINKVGGLYGATYFKQASVSMEKNRAKIAHYFPEHTSSSKARLKDVIKTLNDIEPIYKNIVTLDNTINEAKIQRLSKLTNSAIELIDSLIEQNSKSNVLARHSELKKDLVFAIHTTAKQVELVSYMYSNAIIFYGVFKSLVDDLNKEASLVA